MKIALVCSYDLTRPGGVQAHVLGLAEEMRRRGHTVTVLSPPPSGQLPKRDFERGIIQVGKSYLVPWVGGTEIELTLALGGEARFLKRFLREESFELVHFHNPFLLSHQISAWTASPQMVTLHTTPPEGLAGRLLTAVFTFLGRLWWRRRLKAGIAVSTAPARLVRPLYEALQIIPNGIKTQDFEPSTSTPVEQYQDGRLNILYLGRLEKRKGVRYLIQAYSRVKKNYPEARLMVAGAGPERAALEALCSQLELNDVVFLGPIAEQEKPNWYATCDIYCSPAIHGESFGIVLLEAMASGKPAIGAANVGYRTVLTGAGQQLLFTPRDVESLTVLLESLLESPKLRDELGRWGLERCRRYDWSQVGNRIEEVYRAVVR